VLPLKTDDRGHLLLPVKLGGEDAWLIVDTGHTGQGLLLSRYRLIAMRWASTPVEGDEVKSFLGTTRSRIGRMNGDMTVGQYTVRRPIVAIAYDDDREFIGADILRNFVVTIDQKNNRIRLISPFTGAAATQPIAVPSVKRFGFDFTDTRGTVKVIPGSEAAAADLRDGDRILSMNGVPLERMTYLHQEAMEQSNAALVLRIERGGQQAVLHVPLTVVVP
jgi:membrane-associated protease RseP (regulator of RpoE activity)